MSPLEMLASTLCVFLLIYLFVALFFPENI